MADPAERRRIAQDWLSTYAEGWEPYCEPARVLGQTVAGWARGAIIRRPGIPRLMVLAGVSGIGKSMLARAVHRYWSGGIDIAWERGKWRFNPKPYVIFASWPSLASLDPDNRGMRWHDVAQADLLILDDVGAEVDRFKSGIPIENLREMLERRHYGGGYTLVTTNHLQSEWGKFWDARVDSRLHRDSHIAEAADCPTYNKKT